MRRFGPSPRLPYSLSSGRKSQPGRSVRWRSLAFNHPRCLHTSSSVSKSSRSVFPSTNRWGNSQSTLASKPGSASSNPNRYFQSIRPRTASADCRSGSSSINWSTVIKAKLHGASTERPLCGKREAQSLCFVPDYRADRELSKSPGRSQ